MRPRKKKSAEDEDDDHSADGADEEHGEAAPHVRSRGSILITLRNVVPYTLW